MAPMSGKRFRIAFSFAGEKRDFVARVAALLAKRFGEEKILYDKFHEAEFARYDLGIYLPGLYRDESDLVVAVLCSNYDRKLWTGWEWMAIYAQLTRKEGSKIMLTRFEHAHVDGLFDAAAFVELDNKTPEQLADLILERLALNEGLPKNHYTRDSANVNERRRTSIPNNLPRVQYFFGRDVELKKISEALAEDARGWGALIDGPGGIGKTSLAIRAAELVPEGRFKRIIFLSTKVRELTADGQRSLGTFVLPGYLEMLNAISREIGQPELTKSPEAERSEGVLRALRNADALLVLDNLETLPQGDRDELFAFLNRLPRGCSAIVTSRRRADASAVAVRLDKLEWSAARDLITELAKHNDRLARANEAEQRSLYEETGGNPLLIRWIAGQLGLGRCRTIAAALDFLRSAPAGNDPLEFIFGDLLDTFTQNETRVLAALTYFTMAMDVKFIAELSNLNDAAARGALGDLSSRSLVLPDLEEQRFALVPMVAAFLRAKRPEVVTETGNRLEKRAYALITENGYQKYEQFPVLDTAWSTVAPALPLFLVGPNPRLQTICDALNRFLEFTGRWDELLSLVRHAEAKAVSTRDYVNAGWRAVQAGWVFYLLGQAEEVLSNAARAEEQWRIAKAGDRERAVAVQCRGHGYYLKRDYPSAVAAYQESLALDRTMNAESVDVAIDLNWLANAEKDSGDFAAAERDYQESLRVARTVGYQEGIVTVAGNLANLALAQKDWNAAERLAREAVSLAEKLGRLELSGSDHRHLATALIRQGKAAEALPHAERAVDIFTRLNSPELERARSILKECESGSAGKA